MSQYVDINELTRSVLDSVDEADRTKTAAVADESVALKTETGQAIKSAADQIRSYRDATVTSEDLATVVAGARAHTKTAIFGGSTSGSQMAGGTAGGLGGAAAGAALGSAILPGIGTVAGGIAGGMLGSNVGSNTAQGAMNMTQSGAVQPVGNPAMGAARGPMAPGGAPPKMGSVAGDRLRKIATQVRESGSANEELRLTKAAQMLTAAVGLEHLIKGSQ